MAVKLSVWMITYNHEKFIAQAIESVLMQETDFDYELVIGEDCSTDNTRPIVQDYGRKYPERIRLLLHEKNLGGRQNGRLTREACQGEYIAILEGDDYWTDPHKLQKQVDYMDAHPECAISCHRARVLREDDPDGTVEFYPDVEPESITTFTDLVLQGDYIPTASAVYRSNLTKRLSRSFMGLPAGDYALLLLNALHGNIHYSSEVMSVYRRHAGGVTASWPTKYYMQVRVATCRYLSTVAGPEHRALLRSEIGRLSYELVLHCEKIGDARRARYFAFQRVCAGHFVPELENPIRQLIRLYVPGLHRLARTCKRALGGGK